MATRIQDVERTCASVSACERACAITCVYVGVGYNFKAPRRTVEVKFDTNKYRFHRKNI